MGSSTKVPWSAWSTSPSFSSRAAWTKSRDWRLRRWRSSRSWTSNAKPSAPSPTCGRSAPPARQRSSWCARSSPSWSASNAGPTCASSIRPQPQRRGGACPSRAVASLLGQAFRLIDGDEPLQSAPDRRLDHLIQLRLTDSENLRFLGLGLRSAFGLQKRLHQRIAGPLLEPVRQRKELFRRQPDRPGEHQDVAHLRPDDPGQDLADHGAPQVELLPQHAHGLLGQPHQPREKPHQASRLFVCRLHRLVFLRLHESQSITSRRVMRQALMRRLSGTEPLQGPPDSRIDRLVQLRLAEPEKIRLLLGFFCCVSMGTNTITLRLIRGARGAIFAMASKVYATQTKIHATQIEVYATQTKIHATQIEVYATQTKIYATQTEVHATQIKVYATQTKVYAAQTEIHAAQTKIYATQTEVHAR